MGRYDYKWDIHINWRQFLLGGYWESDLMGGTNVVINLGPVTISRWRDWGPSGTQEDR